MPGADSYGVEVYDLTFKKVASTDGLKATRWTTTLPRGQTYVWQVTARKGDEIFKAPRPPASQARFRIVDGKSVTDIATIRRTHPRSHLLLGIAFAEAGLIDEAIQEFERLARQNPGSELRKKCCDSLEARGKSYTGSADKKSGAKPPFRTCECRRLLTFRGVTSSQTRMITTFTGPEGWLAPALYTPEPISPAPAS